jgi:hypothetical protein
MNLISMAIASATIGEKQRCYQPSLRNLPQTLSAPAAIQMLDLRNLSADYNASDLVHALAKADVVIAHRPEERGGGINIMKGREILEPIRSTELPTTAQMLLLMVANTQQAAMIVGVLDVVEKAGVDAVAVEIFGRTLVSVSDRGELH